MNRVNSGAVVGVWRLSQYFLNIAPEAWLDSVKNYGKNYNTVIGTREGIKRFTQAIGRERKWFCASGYSLQIYQTSPV
ncbi:MAG: hypothetical protein B6D77_18940 [gamma proteobacterium symbiont of Ctena orbiculata]|nr:MAG: hypothetical protein B6D77_18940 [gamma proteobacterium symbiont of Ctena orbiculata]PVV24912.1 MAG: hypothetical protein B6D79_10155 [gamma proteobacterium symbiont of Ctena orbiculata]PVV25459.1 MAG: hypothetical protein B6D78_00265 [gamma proteobacterium symbiont of Ctena orbiculata]